MSVARMVEHGVIKVGEAELRRAILMLVPSADSGIEESNLVKTFFRL